MTTVSRKRRHFRDDFKRQILAEIVAGKLNIHNIKDEDGKPIKALLIERWKDQFRTEGFGMNNYYSQMNGNPVRVVETKAINNGFNVDDLLKEIGRLEIENRQLRSMAFKPQAKTQTAAQPAQVQSAL